MNEHRDRGPDINPHQRCGHSDSSFARMHCHTAGLRKGSKGMDTVGTQTTHHMGSEFRFCCAGIDDEAESSCKRGVTKEFDENAPA